jgi:hypothetical protein
MADITNTDRSQWALKAISAFRKATGTDMEDALADLLADLMHWSDRMGYQFDAELARGRGHYEAELVEDEPGRVLPLEDSAKHLAASNPQGVIRHYDDKHDDPGHGLASCCVTCRAYPFVV